MVRVLQLNRLSLPALHRGVLPRLPAEDVDPVQDDRRRALRGQHAHRLRRSSKKEWLLPGVEGFYWGCNNTKGLQVRLETVADLGGRQLVRARRSTVLTKLKLRP